jgi:hypothetical protein
MYLIESGHFNREWMSYDNKTIELSLCLREEVLQIDR